MAPPFGGAFLLFVLILLFNIAEVVFVYISLSVIFLVLGLKNQDNEYISVKKNCLRAII